MVLPHAHSSGFAGGYLHIVLQVLMHVVENVQWLYPTPPCDILPHYSQSSSDYPILSYPSQVKLFTKQVKSPRLDSTRGGVVLEVTLRTVPVPVPVPYSVSASNRVLGQGYVCIDLNKTRWINCVCIDVI